RREIVEVGERCPHDLAKFGEFGLIELQVRVGVEVEKYAGGEHLVEAPDIAQLGNHAVIGRHHLQPRLREDVRMGKYRARKRYGQGCQEWKGGLHDSAVSFVGRSSCLCCENGSEVRRLSGPLAKPGGEVVDEAANLRRQVAAVR